ncbi:hypothetical protein [Halobellus clavatus]|mgnify:FL=1|jgi:hypothetical protein|uniref:Uncharacterized protein n=1 Tax=Halobellus clavatus TaxID=660517 RepID=A0A1H3JD81_9EURY|nr:hypothetical protein [Halobellus clavatus]SDY37872.1 hypothetical protein SAMN04487946_11324 [Halobellus clavatus]
MSETGAAAGAGIVGTALRIVVGACFVGGAVAALTGRLVLAGGGFLAGHTMLAAAAVIQGQRRRSVGLSFSGVGWLLTSLGLALGQQGAGSSLETPLLVGGLGLVAAGTLLLVGPFGG